MASKGGEAYIMAVAKRLSAAVSRSRAVIATEEGRQTTLVPGTHGTTYGGKLRSLWRPVLLC